MCSTGAAPSAVLPRGPGGLFVQILFSIYSSLGSQQVFEAKVPPNAMPQREAQFAWCSSAAGSWSSAALSNVALMLHSTAPRGGCSYM